MADLEKKKDTVISHNDADAALDFLHSRADGAALTEVNEKTLVRKIDWMIMPLMWAAYFLQYLDKTLINYAAVMGLKEDTNINTDQFSLLALVFYISYLACEPLTGYLMQRFPTAKYLGANVMAWGLCVAMNCVCKNFASLVVVRVLLGCFEAAVAPSLILITGMWYKKNEQPPRVGLWYLGTGTGTVVGALASYGFQHYEGTAFKSWQIMFLLFGLITIIVGGLIVWILPDNPMKSRLTHEEKIWAIERLRENQTGIENKHFKPKQMLEAFRDPQTYFIIFITISSNVPNGAVSSYQATIIQGFGYSSKATALLSIPSGFVSIVSILGGCFVAGRYNQRCVNIVILLFFGGIIGGSMMAFLPEGNKSGKLIGNYLTNCIGATLPLIYSLSSANYAGHTKKVTINAVLLMSFCLGNIIGPETFQESDKPDYIPAKIAIVVTSAIAAILTLTLRFYYQFDNQKRDKKMAGKEHMPDVEFLDLTDRENIEFRYRV
ncbi:MAG: hypothetical protein M1833_003724 [Piccolia ochrophora]|nr:MAG: hypothetical protein M1833_003724 [Piccolia ochrophora]